MLMVALIAENADRSGLPHKRRELVDFLAGLRRLQVRGVNLVQQVEFAAAPGQPALLWRSKPPQVQVGDAAIAETCGKLVL